MQGCTHSISGRLLQVVGTAAFILVVAGTVGVPYSVAATAVFSAALVLILNPQWFLVHNPPTGIKVFVGVFNKEIVSMASVNKAFIVGRLGQDPELKQTPTGKSVANFSVATDNLKNEEPTWHRIIAWEKTADLCKQYLSKGSQVHVEGRIQNRKWTDKDGQTRHTTEIVAERVTFLGSAQQGASRPATASTAQEPAFTEQDIPF